MRLKLLVSFTDGKNAGDEADFEQPEAIRLIEAGFAVPATKQIIETATLAKAPETRARKRKKG